jgi:hypothetical protein
MKGKGYHLASLSIPLSAILEEWEQEETKKAQ